MYLALEGIDTVGKSTQIEMLKEHYSDFLYLTEPSESHIAGKTIREYINSNDEVFDNVMIFLFLANRADLYNKTVLKALKQKQNIITDRSMISAIAYAQVHIDDFALLKQANMLATTDTTPDKVVVLKADKETLKSRLMQKDRDAIETKGYDALLTIQQNIISATKALSIPYIELDCTLKKEEINHKIREFIDEKNS